MPNSGQERPKSRENEHMFEHNFQKVLKTLMMGMLQINQDMFKQSAPHASFVDMFCLSRNRIRRGQWGMDGDVHHDDDDDDDRTENEYNMDYSCQHHDSGDDVDDNDEDEEKIKNGDNENEDRDDG